MVIDHQEKNVRPATFWTFFTNDLVGNLESSLYRCCNCLISTASSDGTISFLSYLSVMKSFTPEHHLVGGSVVKDAYDLSNDDMTVSRGRLKNHDSLRRLIKRSRRLIPIEFYCAAYRATLDDDALLHI